MEKYLSVLTEGMKKEIIRLSGQKGPDIYKILSSSKI